MRLQAPRRASVFIVDARLAVRLVLKAGEGLSHDSMAGDGARDHYSTLGADDGASQEEIERLYKALARRHHPDRGGDEETMKAINEAYGVLGDAEQRRSYDEGRGGAGTLYGVANFAPRPSPSAQADALGGRLLGAWLCTLSGLVLLMLVRFHYVKFLWPLALLAFAVVAAGILMAHGALVFARRSAGPEKFFGRFAWAQETAFWSAVCAGAYGVYLVLTAV